MAKKYCKECGTTTKESDNFCPNCGCKDFLDNIANKEYKSTGINNSHVNGVGNSGAKIVIIIIIIFLVISGIIMIPFFGIFGSIFNDTKDELIDDSYTIVEKEEVENKDDNKTEEKSYDLGDTFLFDGFEITMGTEVKVEHYVTSGVILDVVKIPITLTNKSVERDKITMVDYDIKRPDGTDAISYDGFYKNEAFDYMGYIEPGVTVVKNMYVQYDGDGVYTIVFDSFDIEQKEIVKIDVSRY